MPRIPLTKQPRAFLDTETTGLNPMQHEIIEIAIVLEHQDGRVEEWCSKIKPVRLDRAEPKALEINGYAAHPELWENAPTFEEVLVTVLAKLDNAMLVGHNVSFDHSFVQEAIYRAGSKVRMGYHKVDTVGLAYAHLVPLGLESLSLDAIRTFLGWSKDGAHTALVDARDCRRLYHHILSRVQTQTPPA